MELQSLLDYIFISFIPLAVGMSIRYAARKKEKPFLTSLVIILLVMGVCLLSFMFKRAVNDVMGLLLTALVFMVFGASLSDLVAFIQRLLK